MLIRVVYKNDKYDFLNPARLDESLKTGIVAMFQRSSGWARVGVDPLRKMTHDAPHDKLVERRHS
jgi:hypothetical protein